MNLAARTRASLIVYVLEVKVGEPQTESDSALKKEEDEGGSTMTVLGQGLAVVSSKLCLPTIANKKNMSAWPLKLYSTHGQFNLTIAQTVGKL